MNNNRTNIYIEWIYDISLSTRLFRRSHQTLFSVNIKYALLILNNENNSEIHGPH